MPRSDLSSPSLPDLSSRVRHAARQLTAAVQEFWWGYWQAPPGC